MASVTCGGSMGKRPVAANGGKRRTAARGSTGGRSTVARDYARWWRKGDQGKNEGSGSAHWLGLGVVRDIVGRQTSCIEEELTVGNRALWRRRGGMPVERGNRARGGGVLEPTKT
ncbi:hypothetical protein E2562_007755 [Oryza meyeriana var. granulata]|uniref:Uncharacterized protein n=1 Tax=Oryza meyeriana var. granulata TaxID=110450 RepID=A0A6G1EHM0_9ORYZ|nr:hypothetical protein E2562_007755 [Oryza meyeriana var. granulata]